MERTLVLLKPDTLQRRLVGEVIRRFELKGLTLCGLKMMRLDETAARANYVEHPAIITHNELIFTLKFHFSMYL